MTSSLNFNCITQNISTFPPFFPWCYYYQWLAIGNIELLSIELFFHAHNYLLGWYNLLLNAENSILLQEHGKI